MRRWRFEVNGSGRTRNFVGANLASRGRVFARNIAEILAAATFLPRPHDTVSNLPKGSSTELNVSFRVEIVISNEGYVFGFLYMEERRRTERKNQRQLTLNQGKIFFGAVVYYVCCLSWTTSGISPHFSFCKQTNISCSGIEGTQFDRGQLNFFRNFCTKYAQLLFLKLP